VAAWLGERWRVVEVGGASLSKKLRSCSGLLGRPSSLVALGAGASGGAAAVVHERGWTARRRRERMRA
jgi:hypothetical protein